LKPARFAAFLIVVLGLAATGFWFAANLYLGPGPSAETVRVLIPKGSGARDIAELLEAKRVVPNAWVFLGGARIDGQIARLKAGEYDIPPRASGREIAALIASGKAVVRRITFAEGLMSGQIAALLNAAEGLDGDTVAVPPEGSVLPDTYFYAWGDPRGRIVERATRAMRDTLAELWAKRAEGLPLRDPAEALVLASIVERETGHADERGRVAAVFVNRLRRGMRLQADPTVAYGVDRMAPLGRPLSRADLDTRHEWNTYVIAGLPPTPIANPGRASIEAVLNPPQTDELFFVADGEGRHAFARDLAEHNRNVAKLREIERNRAAPR
jgi:UPF0755 protein